MPFVCSIELQTAMHWFITVIKLLFSSAAATRSLSANCLFTAISDECVPGVISTVTLNRGGSDRSNFTRIDKPINVAMLQCGIVGVKLTKTSLCSLSTFIKFCWTTCNSSNVSGCSGSFMNRIKSKKHEIVDLYGMQFVAKYAKVKSFDSTPSPTKYFSFIERIGHVVI